MTGRTSLNYGIRKHVQNFGEGIVDGSAEGGTIDGVAAGNRDEHYYYAGWAGSREPGAA